MTSKIIFDLLYELKEMVFAPCNLRLSHLIIENESKAYSACRFELNTLKIIFRTAKVTPTKSGQFVTLWKRIENGTIQPFDFSDKADLFIINTKNGFHSGQFIFPKSVLLQKGVLSTESKEGKRAFRVYSPWDLTSNKQAKNTQKWQLDYFLEIQSEQEINFSRVKMLYSQNA
jgi:hypothetical protein